MAKERNGSTDWEGGKLLSERGGGGGSIDDNRRKDLT